MTGYYRVRAWAAHPVVNFIYHMGGYAGYPAAANAGNLARDVLTRS
jgi:hypothetical protein